MNLVFLDPKDWDYDVSAPFERPLGGSESAHCYLAIEMARRGHRVTLLTGTTRPREVLGVSCLSWRSVPAGFLKQPLDAFVVSGGPADVCHQLRPQLAPATPLVLWTGQAPDQPMLQGLQTPEVRDGWDAVGGVSDWHRQGLIRRFALVPRRVFVLHNAIAPAFAGLFSSADELATVKERPILAYTSTPFRGLDLLLGVFPELRRGYPEAVLRVYSSMEVYGHDAEQDDYAALYEQCRRTPGVEYVGSLPQPQLAGALKRAAILAYPSTFAETSCIAVLEAMAAGLFVLGSDLGALAETTRGFASLVPAAGGTRSRDEFASAYLARLQEVLAEWARSPAAFAAGRWKQVQTINAEWTWAVRARQWEETIPAWKSLRAAPARTPAGSNETVPSTDAPWLEVTSSPGLAAWLAEQQVSLAFSTYQTGKLFLVGRSAADRLAVHERTFNGCMGLWTDGQTLWMSSLFQLWRFENALRPGHLHDGHDRLYVPRTGYTTGEVDVHDVAVESSGRVLFVNTKFNCLATVSERDSFTPLWRPPFVSGLVAEDRCHLNGLALQDGRGRYVTAVSTSDVADGWRQGRRDGGVVVDVVENRVVAGGLSMPHSPRVHRGRLWLLESGTGRLGTIDLQRGRFEPVAFCPGYLRGLAFVGDYAVVGLSRPRHDRTFTGLALDEELTVRGAAAECGLQVIDLRSGTVVHWLRLEGMVSELYDVCVLPGVVRPMALGFKTDEVQRLLSVGAEEVL